MSVLNFKKFSLRQRLFALNLLMSFFVLGMGLVGFWYLSNIANSVQQISSNSMPELRDVKEVNSAVKDVARGLLGAFASDTEEQRARQVGVVERALAAFSKAANELDAADLDSKEMALWNSIKAKESQYRAITDVALEAIRSGSSDRILASEQKFLDGQAFELRGQLFSELDQLTTIVADSALEEAKEAEEEARAAEWWLGVLAVLGMASTMLLGYFFARALAETLRKITESLRLGSGEVTTASKMIASAGESLSSGASEQAAALQETASSLEEITSMVSNTADNAKRSLQVAEESKRGAVQGKRSLDEMIVAVGEISRANQEVVTAVDSGNREIEQIVKVISEIGAKTKVINDIVFQTKLLSFNASVEAARAGEHGKGFAVVAEEVGNLAQMSGNAAKEIGQLLESSIQNVERIIKNNQSRIETILKDAKGRVDRGEKIAKECSEILETIVRNIEGVNSLADQISQASNQQSTGIAEINKAMSELDSVTHENAQSAQSSASAAVELKAQAESLNEIVNELTRVVQGAGNVAARMSDYVEHHEPRSHLSSNSSGGVKNVVPARAPAPVSSAEPAPSNGPSAFEPISWRPMNGSAPKASPSAGGGKLKKVVGFESELPSENDPRFQDL